MKRSRSLPIAAACAAAFALSLIPASPASAEITHIDPGSMRCSYGFIEVNVPRSANEYNDHYTPLLLKWTASTGWQLHTTGTMVQWSRSQQSWNNAGQPQKFQVPIGELANETYWSVIQRVVDFETGFYWDATAYLPNHDPEYCNATGPWD
jgi:hypothetical protein